MKRSAGIGKGRVRIGWGIIGAILMLVMAASLVRAEQKTVWDARIVYFDFQKPAGIEFVDVNSNLMTDIACKGKAFLNPNDTEVETLRVKIFGAALSGKPVNVVYDDNASMGGSTTCQIKAIW